MTHISKEFDKTIVSSLDYKTVKEALGKLRAAADPATLVVGKDEFLAITTEVSAFETSLVHGRRR